MEIVRAAEHHVPGIIELWKEFIDYHKEIEPVYARTADGVEKFEEYLKKLMVSDDLQVLVALNRGEVVAYSIAQISKRPPMVLQTEFGFISDLGVRSDYRRRGLGEKVLSRIIEWFESRRVKRIELLVLSQNHAAVSFWKKHGFETFVNRMFLSVEEKELRDEKSDPAEECESN